MGGFVASDLRLACDWADHWKTRGLIRKCGPDAPRCLIRLWSYAADRRPNGDLSGLSADEIADAAKWPETEPSDRFIAALVDLRWLDGEDGNYRLHDWHNHQPWIADREKRREAARALAERSWESRRAATADAARTENECATHPKTVRGACETTCAPHRSGDARRIENRCSQPNPTQPITEISSPREEPDPAPDPEPLPEKPTPGKRATAADRLVSDLVNLWNESAWAAGAVKCRVVARSWEAQLRARWDASGKTDADRLAMFRSQCDAVAASRLCTGKAKGKDGEDPWRASLEWLTKEANWAKVANGNYRRDNVPARAPDPLPLPAPLPDRTAPTVDWPAVVEVLASRGQNGQVDQWIRPLVYIGNRGKALELVAPDDFHADFVAANFNEPIRDALRQVTGKTIGFMMSTGGPG